MFKGCSERAGAGGSSVLLCSVLHQAAAPPRQLRSVRTTRHNEAKT